MPVPVVVVAPTTVALRVRRFGVLEVGRVSAVIFGRGAEGEEYRFL